MIKWKNEWLGNIKLNERDVYLIIYRNQYRIGLVEQTTLGLQLKDREGSTINYDDVTAWCHLGKEHDMYSQEKTGGRRLPRMS